MSTVLSTTETETETATPTAVTVDREPWPEIDRLAPEAEVALAVDPSWYAAGKVLLDYTVAALMLPIALPLMGLAALAVKLSSTGPVFYTQTRLGLNGRPYRIYKIRSMHHNVEARSGIQWAKENDPRVFTVGKVLRKTHLDELPQLFNVLMGHMSLVGPRPERPEVIDSKGLERVVPGYRHRTRVKPGVTGLAQLQLPPDSDLTSVRYKVVYDLYYVGNQGLAMDLRLILATAAKAAGLKPWLIRRLFLLPSRRTVAATFRRNVAAPEEFFLGELQPA
ncbi:MAG: sugar transferase [Gemmataceae bacterium]|nr:sugar transferase [Gemmataceae bacterium]